MTAKMLEMLESAKRATVIRAEELAKPLAGRCLAGTELKRLLSRLGFNANKSGCQCNQHAIAMDSWGCDECEARIDEIVGWLAVEAAGRKLPFVHAVAKMLVRRAIANARLVAKKAANQAPPA